MGQLGCKIWNFRWEFLLYSGLGFALEVMQDEEADEMMYLSCIYHNLSKLFGVSSPSFLRIIGQLVALILVWTTYLALANRSLVQALLQNAPVRQIGLFCWQVVVEIWWRAQEIRRFADFRCSESTLKLRVGE